MTAGPQPAPPRRGRGQPPALTGDRLTRLLAHLADGLTIQQAADQVGVTRATVHNTQRRDPEAAAAITAARAAGKTVRAAAKHGTEGCYTHRGCRRPECTAAATDARTQRRTETAAATTPVLAAVPTPARTTVAILTATEPPLAEAG